MRAVSGKSVAAGLVIVAYFLLLSCPTRASYLDNDSVLNIAFLHGYGKVSFGVLLAQALTVLTGEYRPVGGLYYRTLFALFGLNPGPYRIAAFVLLGLNLALAARWFRQLSNSRFTAAAATLLFSFHPALAQLYYGAGTVYDVLCLFFVLLALGAYTRIRRENQFLTLQTVLLLIGLEGAALGSKEMALTLPAVLILYEAAFHPHLRNIRQRLVTVVALTLLTALCMVWKAWVPNPMSTSVGQNYTPRFQPAFVGRQYVHYYQLLSLHYDLQGRVLAAILVLAAVVALVLRNRVMLFGFLFANLTLLPVCVIPGRGGFVWYMPLLGWAIYGGSAISQLSAKLASVMQALLRTEWMQAALFGSLVILLYAFQARQARNLSAPFLQEQRYLRSLLGAARDALPNLPAGSRILLESDPFGPDSLMPLFLLRLGYRDPTLWVDQAPHAADASLYTMRMRWNESGYQVTVQPQSQGQPVHVAFSPGLVHRGNPLQAQFPAALAGCTVDVAYRMPEDELMRAGAWPSWIQLDADGKGMVHVDQDVERGRVEIERLRPCHRGWILAQGSFVIIP